MLFYKCKNSSSLVGSAQSSRRVQVRARVGAAIAECASIGQALPYMSRLLIAATVTSDVVVYGVFRKQAQNVCVCFVLCRVGAALFVFRIYCIPRTTHRIPRIYRLLYTAYCLPAWSLHYFSILQCIPGTAYGMPYSTSHSAHTAYRIHTWYRCIPHLCRILHTAHLLPHTVLHTPHSTAYRTYTTHTPHIPHTYRTNTTYYCISRIHHIPNAHTPHTKRA